ncbi:hypothetical protein P4E94_12030 [Pontiellaceae bacterium B12219]|nr:hypothetical protein [Pontiellaceae bacterium B12219]
MKTLVQTYRGVVKGTSSGWIISILLHLGVALLATSIFLVVQKPAPPIMIVREPVKLDLIRPQVRIEQSSSPARQVTPISVTKNSLDRPQMEVPELGANLGDTGLDLSMDFGAPEATSTLVGDSFGTGFDFVGTFYDFKRDRTGRTVPMDPHQFVAEVAGFIRGDWRISELARFYRSPKQLYAGCFMVPPVKSSVAPAAFDEADTVGYCWLAHYKGQLVYHDDITFRFWGQGDDIMAVRVDGEEVLMASWPGGSWSTQEALTSAAGGWQSSSPKSRTYTMGNNKAVVGDWITLKKGEPLDMEVIIGEVPGGTFCSMLTVEVQGVDYALNREQAPILPMFKTVEPSRDLKDRIYESLTYDHAAVNGGPVFRDIPPSELPEAQFQPLEAPINVPASPIRIWTRIDGAAVKGEFVSRMGDQVVLKNALGSTVRIPFGELSSDDRKVVELAEPPAFNCSFTKQSSQRIIKTTPYLNEIPPRLLEYTFGAKMKQTTARAYPHRISVELFVLGQQRIDDRKFVLLDHQVSSFIPDSENGRSHIFRGEPVELMSYDTSEPHGQKYSDYLLVLTDERGEIIQHSSSANWLFPNLGKLRNLKVGNFLDKTGARVYPTGPGPKSLYD